MSEHTKEPWEYERIEDDNYRINHRHDNDGETQIIGTLAETYCEENARRIVACVNACAGIDTERLEHKIEETHSLLEKSVFLVEELDDTRKHRDEAIAALESLLASHETGIVHGFDDPCECQACKARDVIARLKS